MLRKLFPVVTLVVASSASAQFRVDTKNPQILRDGRGEALASNLVGINDQQMSATSIEEIAKTGANCVREFWTTQGNVWIHGTQNKDDIDAYCKLIDRARRSHMLFIGALWDATGISFKDDKFKRIVEFWLTNAPKLRTKDNLIIDVANEAGWTKDGDFLPTWNEVISKLRKAGYRQPIMVEAPDYGRGVATLFADSDHNAKPDCQDILRNDPLHNVVFSWHLYDPAAWSGGQGTKDAIKKWIEESVKANISFSIGEFAHVEQGQKKPPKGRIEWRYAMELAKKNNVGFSPWMWYSVNDAHSLTTDGIYGHWGAYATEAEPEVKWGEEAVVSLPYSIERTAKRTRQMAGWR